VVAAGTLLMGSTKGLSAMTRATGTFEVKLTPQSTEEGVEGIALARMTLDKVFHGDLDATSKGEMLTAGTSRVKNSAGYVAIERVTGTLHGRRGSFALQHNGVMTRGDGRLTISVVPDSGTDELVGLTGKMDIKVAEGKHFYHFDYAIATP
jgi:hypothetical protein